MGKIKPILSNTDMVRAILEGRKTVTRRVVKPQPRGHAALLTDNLLPETVEAGAGPVYAFEDGTVTSQPYRPGDILYVRETWGLYHQEPGFYVYKADKHAGTEFDGFKWCPSIHMPREAARIFLRVTDVWVERLQEITEDEAVKEGVEAYHSDSGYYEPATLGFVEVWNSTIKKAGRALYGWDANPWVWVIEFERIGREEAQHAVE